MNTPAPVYTRCPGCATVFRVSAQQLALREGQVRCGHCRAVFDAHKERVSLDVPRGDDGDDHDELAAGRPTVTLRSADALLPVGPKPDAPPPRAAADADAATEAAAEAATTVGAEPVAAVSGELPPNAATVANETPSNEAAIENETPADEAAIENETRSNEAAVAPQMPADEAAVATEQPASEAPAAAASDDAPIRVDDIGLRSARFEWKPRKSLRERPKTAYGAAIVLLVVALLAQALFEYRDALAAHAPFTRPVLQAACSVFGCAVGPLHDAGALSIDASDLRADPAHRGLLQLSATIRNRAPYSIAFPDLELTLTDLSERVVARRAFAPAEYAGAAADIARGIPANGEDVVTLFLDASETSQSGYRLYLFYP